MPPFREEIIEPEHAGQRYGKGANRPAAPACSGRYGFPGSADRLAYGTDKRADRPLQDARQRPPFAARIAEDGEPAPQDTRLPQAKEQREISRADRATWPAQVNPPRPWDPDGRFESQIRSGGPAWARASPECQGAAPELLQ